MLILLSPAKKQSTQPLAISSPQSTPIFQNEIGDLLSVLQTKTPPMLQSLMQISEALSVLNHKRFQSFDAKDYRSALPVLAQLQGDAYQSLDASHLDADDLAWAQRHLVILSGLYGVLRPLDAMHPYRLEMKTKLSAGVHKDLYQFWGHKLMDYLAAACQDTQSSCIINLASNEYSKAALPKGHTLPVININFKDLKNGAYKTIGLYAKRARGAMARAIIVGRMTSPAQLKTLNLNGYVFQEDTSTDTTWVYHRAHVS